ncbi:MAG: hypothetical protein ACI976_002045 [Aureispira sp.]|jgi:hypothetical protein
MNKIPFFSFFFFIAINLFAQDSSPSGFMKTANGLLYFDNTQGVHSTFEIPGKSVNKMDIPGAFMIDEEFVQIMKHEYDRSKLGNPQNLDNEKKILEFYKNYELDYFQDEIFKEKVEFEEELFVNSKGKRFLLWYYKMPKSALAEIDEEDLPNVTQYQLFLSNVSNNYVTGININSYTYDTLANKIQYLKELAENYCIYGGKIDLEALSYKLQTIADGDGVEYDFTKKGFKFRVPNWLNMTDIGKGDSFMGTLPDVDNIKNAIALEWYDKKTLKRKLKIKTFADFNKKNVVQKKIGDKMGRGTVFLNEKLETPKNCTGVCFKVQMLIGNSIYHTQILTFESKNTYILMRFVATPDTYELNLNKFEAFIKGLEITD